MYSSSMSDRTRYQFFDQNKLDEIESFATGNNLVRLSWMLLTKLSLIF